MLYWLLLLFGVLVADGAHFNGGTIRWAPINPFDNSSSVAISIIQTYYWTYPSIICANDVPISSPGRSSQNVNLTCVVDCSTDGGYSTRPISILTDCASASVAMGLMQSERSVNMTLAADAHFYLAYVGSAWRSLGYPAVSGLQWSMLTSIDLHRRSDGFINTPPTVNIVSPQYVFVNQTTQIRIPVSDVNAGDSVRCRWARVVSGYRRRKRSNDLDFGYLEKSGDLNEKITQSNKMSFIRNKRGKVPCSNCTTLCIKGCSCACAGCTGTTCSGSQCMSSTCAVAGSATTRTTSSTTMGTSGSTTTETPGILLSTSSYPIRQTIDECGGICYPSIVPGNTTLDNCTLSFLGLVPNTWYSIAIQVTDSSLRTLIL